MELSWDIRTTEGEPSACATDFFTLTTVYLECQTLDGNGSCSPRQTGRAWPCEEKTGSTRFDIPEGRWRFQIRPRCPDGRRAEVRVPDPVVRDITIGEVAQLNALLIVVDLDAPPCQGSASTMN